jgi:hypothetical protein
LFVESTTMVNDIHNISLTPGPTGPQGPQGVSEGPYLRSRPFEKR